MKKIYLSVLVSLMSLISAKAAGYKSVVINHTDGTSVAVTMENGMTTKVGQGNLVLSCVKGDITFPVEDVRNWTFSTDGGNSDLWADVDLPLGDEVGCVQEPDRIVLTNLPAGSYVMLVGMSGRIMNRATSVSGSYELPLTGLQQGVYVLTFNNKSIKIAVAR